MLNLQTAAPGDSSECELQLHETDDDNLHRHLTMYLSYYMQQALLSRGHEAQQLLRNCLHASAYLAHRLQSFTDAEGIALMRDVETVVGAAYEQSGKVWNHLTDIVE